ncbi:DUF1232 domain-containing protein [Aeromonas caviae]|uniref:DUF1232 domain-containing protein n=1 Tax=Aeromonas caviae TaxID=648 RepID=A0A7T3X0T5_AERCA|nr:DUF1232 domain-containing protein [Aeromonas caviae]
MLLYVLLTDGDLPVWCYALIIGALAYLVNPFDVVPDPIPLPVIWMIYRSSPRH